MKASDFIIHLQQMIEEHGDLPLALMENNEYYGKVVFIKVDTIEQVYILGEDDSLYDNNDDLSPERKVFLID